MTILTVNATTNFSGLTLNNVTKIQFGNTSGTISATYTGSQFDGVQILNNVEIAGSAGTNAILINGAHNFDASSWIFTNWSATDVITINGGTLADNIKGSSKADTINGGNGNDIIAGGGGGDILNGGAGNDTFAYDTGTDIVTGEIIRGGTSIGDSGTNDRINVSGTGSLYDFRNVTISGIETIDFSTANLSGRTAKLSEAHTAAGQINHVIGGGTSDTLEIEMSGGLINLNHLTFNNWTQSASLTSGGDFVRITGGTAGQDTITGTTVNDIAIYSGGSDFIALGQGSDQLQLQAGTAGELFYFGSNLTETDTGIDSVVIGGAGTYDLRDATFFSVERLAGLGGTSGLVRDIILDGDQVGAGKLNIFADSGNTSTNVTRMNVIGSQIDLGTATGSGIDLITLDGTSGNDVLTTLFNTQTVINAGEGDDVITGGQFAAQVNGTTSIADNLFGGGGNDTFVYNNSGSLLSAGEIIDGATGTADRILFQTNNGSSLNSGDFSEANITGVELFEFAGTSTADQVVTFAASQLSAITNIIGNENQDVVLVEGSGTVNLSSKVTTNFEAGSMVGFSYRQGDHFEFIGGTAGVDNFTGTSVEDRFTTTGGADTLQSGAGNDFIVVNALAHLTGLTVDMGGGSDDTLQFKQAGTFAIGSNLANVENLDFGNGVFNISIDGSRFNAGGIDHLSSAGDVALTVNGNTNMSAVTFGGWDSDNSITILGNDLDNTLIGSLARDTINGGLGNDTIQGGSNQDVLIGGEGNDRFVMTTRTDLVSGPVDSLVVDTLDGGVGTDDRIVQTSEGGGFFDEIDLTFGALTGIEAFEFAGATNANQHATIKNNQLGTGKVNQIIGNQGADVLNIQFTSAVMNVSTLGLTNWTDGIDQIVARITAGDNGNHTATGTAFGDRFQMITLGNHVVNGGGGDDVVETGFGNDTINGGAGSDSISTADGNDTLTGGLGIDLLAGGLGNDIFVLQPNTADRDTIQDFTAGTDRLRISAALFGGGLVAGALDPTRFVSNTAGTALDANDRFIYDQSTGNLFYDSNGSDAGGTGGLIATLLGNPNLQATDFTIVA